MLDRCGDQKWNDVFSIVVSDAANPATIERAPSRHHSGILLEYLPGSREAWGQPGVFSRLGRCSAALQHRAAAQGRTVMPQWHDFACDALFMAGLACGGRGVAQPSLSTQRNEQRNCCAYSTFHNYGAIYMLVKPMEFAQQFSESLVIAVVF